MKRILSILSGLLFGAWIFLSAQDGSQKEGLKTEGGYPLIRRFTPFDPAYTEQQKGLEKFYRDSTRDELNSAPKIYLYRVSKGTSLATLAAQAGLDTDTLSTLNGFTEPRLLAPEEFVYIPDMVGIFLRDKPKTDLEKMLLKNREKEKKFSLVLREDKKQENLSFYPRSAFSQKERRIFLGEEVFLPPLKTLFTTSKYGYRIHPITGKWKKHTGIDYRAAMDSKVFASRAGKVLEAGREPGYGNMIMLGHRHTYETVYGHLDKILVKKNDTVEEGQVIGYSGNTGISTGPHLHFEIRKNGKSVDPEFLLARKN